VKGSKLEVCTHKSKVAMIPSHDNEGLMHNDFNTFTELEEESWFEAITEYIIDSGLAIELDSQDLTAVSNEEYVVSLQAFTAVHKSFFGTGTGSRLSEAAAKAASELLERITLKNVCSHLGPERILTATGISASRAVAVSRALSELRERLFAFVVSSEIIASRRRLCDLRGRQSGRVRVSRNKYYWK
jgi:GNAT superfamily N-acetyltransferase